jgi:hypothetical protein
MHAIRTHVRGQCEVRSIRTRVRSEVISPAWAKAWTDAGWSFLLVSVVLTGRPADRRELLVWLSSELYPAAASGAPKPAGTSTTGTIRRKRSQATWTAPPATSGPEQRTIRPGRGHSPRRRPRRRPRPPGPGRRLRCRPELTLPAFAVRVSPAFGRARLKISRPGTRRHRGHYPADP